eukprot:CAMPEP_0113276720 /NCGR_PEP_ID=MMETSP0008_2-20120614/25642_1 /TAXON_ID=97485 /ORGANISM="Prymnesium parvum" /LENGTH=132 /DNA_ID=CAMNT_0000126537 /DNA_START=198 /DNA_END=592 /DNA_ORIENTATION=- /assembly_acc=CAM_ASM_000153
MNGKPNLVRLCAAGSAATLKFDVSEPLLGRTAVSFAVVAADVAVALKNHAKFPESLALQSCPADSCSTALDSTRWAAASSSAPPPNRAPRRWSRNAGFRTIRRRTDGVPLAGRAAAGFAAPSAAPPLRALAA